MVQRGVQLPVRLLGSAICTFLCVTGTSVAAEEATQAGIAGEIRAVLAEQEAAWNRGDIDGFMEHYWKSPELTFCSGGKTVRGWTPTLERYRQRYPDAAAMGKTTFSQLEIRSLGPDAAWVLGRWHLQKDEPLGGNFTLILRRIDGRWQIVHDHTSLEDAERVAAPAD